MWIKMYSCNVAGWRRFSGGRWAPSRAKRSAAPPRRLGARSSGARSTATARSWLPSPTPSWAAGATPAPSPMTCRCCPTSVSNGYTVSSSPLLPNVRLEIACGVEIWSRTLSSHKSYLRYTATIKVCQNTAFLLTTSFYQKVSFWVAVVMVEVPESVTHLS